MAGRHQVSIMAGRHITS